MFSHEFISILSASPVGKFSFWIEALAEYFDKAEKHNRVLRILWFVCTVGLLLLSTAIALLLAWLWTWKVAAFFVVVIWAVFFGATGLLFLPPRAMTAIFGTTLGLSISEISSGAGLLEAANRAITSTSAQIGAVMTPGVDADPFIRILVWTFVLVTMLVSLPAFFAQGEPSDAPLETAKQPARTAPKDS